MRHRRFAAGLALMVAALVAPAEAAERPRVVEEAMSLDSGGKTINVIVYRPDDGAKHPAIVYLHGGGFSFEDPVMARFHTEMARRGLVVVAPHWLVDGTGWYDWQKTAAKAVTLAASLPSVDPDHIGMSGISMGGQTGLSTAARDRRIKAVAEFFTAWPGTLPDEPIDSLPPVLLLNGTADPIIPFDKAMALDGILKEHHLPFERHVYEGLGHGFSTAASFKDAVVRTAVFFGGTAEPTGSKPGEATPFLPIRGRSPGSGGYLELVGDESLAGDDLEAWLIQVKAKPLASKKKKKRSTAAKTEAPSPVTKP